MAKLIIARCHDPPAERFPKKNRDEPPRRHGRHGEKK
jgi:hypothetical protein